jgi:hypothetical protein
MHQEKEEISKIKIEDQCQLTINKKSLPYPHIENT